MLRATRAIRLLRALVAARQLAARAATDERWALQSPADQAALTEALATLVAWLREYADAAAPLDALACHAATTSADPITPLDALLTALDKALADGAALSDSLAVTLGQALDDLLAAADALTRAWSAERSLADASAPTEAVAWAAAGVQADAATPLDTAWREFMTTVQDSLAVGETVALQLASALSLTDAGLATDAWASARTRFLEDLGGDYVAADYVAADYAVTGSGPVATDTCTRYLNGVLQP